MKRVVIKGAVVVMSALMIMSCVLSSLQEVKAAKKPKLNKTKVELEVGKTVKLKLSNAKKVKWSSSKKKVATVNKKGVVTAKKKGKAVISAKYKKKSYKCKVTVEDKEINVVPTATVTPEIPQATVMPTVAPTVAPTPSPIPTEENTEDDASWERLCYSSLALQLMKNGERDVNDKNERVYSVTKMDYDGENMFSTSISYNSTLKTTTFTVTYINVKTVNSQCVMLDIVVAYPEVKKGTISSMYVVTDSNINLFGTGEIELSSIVSVST